MKHFEIVIVGAGLAGQVAALALARTGRSVCVLATQPQHDDSRTTALMDQSVRYLERLGVWHKILPSAAPLSTMQILDGTNRLLRAAPAQFRAMEIGLSAFGYNIPNAELARALNEAIDAEPNITRLEAGAAAIALSDTKVTISTTTGEVVDADFIIGADGRNSITRETAGIAVRKWSYRQAAVVLNFGHSLPHQNTSTEFHTESGPFTQVPLPGLRSSLVWVVRPEEAARLTALPVAELSAEVETRMQSILGKVAVEGGAQSWPLSSMMAHSFGKGRLALIGEAAHAFPPIGAQGLNLSLRDSIALAELLSAAGDRPIDSKAGDRYNRRRRVDVMSRTFSVDLLNRSLLTDFLPIQMLRAAGLQVLNAVPPLRSALMQEGVEPGRGLRNLFGSLGKQIRRQ